jgi:response regulator NasT
VRILIADDEAIIRIGLRAMLTDAGHEIAGMATNGKSAVQLASLRAPDVVIMDVKMPEMDGLTASRQIMAHSPTAIVLMTAYSERALIEEAKGAAVFAYLVKPVREELLCAALELARARFLEWRELRAEVEGLQASLLARDRVEAAKRVLMARLGIGEREAYLRIQREARSRRISMQQVAEEALADAGETRGDMTAG